MTSARAWTLSMSLVLMMVPVPGLAQTLGAATSVSLLDGGAELPAKRDPWEFTIGGRIGAPVGHLQVGESIGTGSTPGTRMRLSDLGVHISETIEASVAYHFTPDDALRVSALYTFMRGDSTPSQSVVYNGLEFKPGSLHTNADYWRIDLAYERAFVRSPADELIGSIGLAYVFFNPTLSNSQHNGGENSEDFYLQELPVPIAGLRWTHQLSDHWGFRLGVAGAGSRRSTACARKAAPSTCSRATRTSTPRSCIAGVVEPNSRSATTSRTSSSTRRATRTTTGSSSSTTASARGSVCDSKREGAAA